MCVSVVWFWSCRTKVRFFLIFWCFVRRFCVLLLTLRRHDDYEGLAGEVLQGEFPSGEVPGGGSVRCGVRADGAYVEEAGYRTGGVVRGDDIVGQQEGYKVGGEVHAGGGDGLAAGGVRDVGEIPRVVCVGKERVCVQNAEPWGFCRGVRERQGGSG